MGKDHRGQPSGTNKSEGTGLSTDLQNQDLDKNEEMTDKYLSGEDELNENVREKNPNRNTDKDKPTNAHGYKY